MNREIKFRAFQDNKMLTSPIGTNYGLNRFFGMLYQDAPLMQFTGLKDSELKEIYNKDIVDFTWWTYVGHEIEEHKIGTIEIDEFGTYFKDIKEPERKWYLSELEFDSAADIEVIGNIYESPDKLR